MRSRAPRRHRSARSRRAGGARSRRLSPPRRDSLSPPRRGSPSHERCAPRSPPPRVRMSPPARRRSPRSRCRQGRARGGTGLRAGGAGGAPCRDDERPLRDIRPRASVDLKPSLRPRRSRRPGPSSALAALSAPPAASRENPGHQRPCAGPGSARSEGLQVDFLNRSGKLQQVLLGYCAISRPTLASEAQERHWPTIRRSLSPRPRLDRKTGRRTV
jgi:hypothetical protein